MSPTQTARTVLMVRPGVFHGNPQTAASNLLQGAAALPDDALLAAAQREFDAAAAALSRAGVSVIVLDAPPGPLPDALFPNNWFSTHADGKLVLYPMMAPNRRRERLPGLPHVLEHRQGFQVREVVDLTPLEARNEFVEGTGSLVLDRVDAIAYVGVSPRSTPAAIHEACVAIGAEACSFVATHAAGAPIYHTNVMLSVGSRVAIGCFESIRDADQRALVMDRLQASGKTLLALTERQMLEFAANVLELDTPRGPLLAVSTRAWRAYSTDQRRVLEAHLAICPVEVDTIERVGGGGIRCMLAEIHLPAR